VQTTAVTAQEAGDILNGAAIADHSAGKAILDACPLLAAGKLAQVKSHSVADVREEWAAMSQSAQLEEARSSQERAPDCRSFGSDVAARGTLTFFGDSAQLVVPTEDQTSAVVAFVNLEEDSWRVTAGPLIVDTGSGPSAEPQLQGAEILDHEIGTLLLTYSSALAKDADSAMEFLTRDVQIQRLALSAEERAESDRYRRSLFVDSGDFGDLIRNGGSLYLEEERASFSAVSNTSVTAADGTTSYSTMSMSVPLALEDGVWKIAN
jgi:hypothetical protein